MGGCAYQQEAAGGAPSRRAASALGPGTDCSHWHRHREWNWNWNWSLRLVTPSLRHSVTPHWCALACLPCPVPQARRRQLQRVRLARWWAAPVRELFKVFARRGLAGSVSR